MADFVFFRTFDVAQCKIMNEIDEQIAGIGGMYFAFRACHWIIAGFLII